MSASALSRHLPLTVWRNRSLLLQLCKRDIVERYRGSSGGLVWSLITPLAMLAIYTFVFGVIFNARWAGRDVSRVDFALLLFTGLLAFGIFGEVAQRAPALIASRPNFVKKIVFPLELMPVVSIVNALFHFAAGFAILLFSCLLVYGALPWTVVLAPLTLVPVVLLSLGTAWLLSSLGVFVPDLRHAMPFVSTAIMFLTPVFYPVTQVPGLFREVMYWNPLTIPVENLRAVTIFGEQPGWIELAASTAGTALFAALCFLWFQRARRHFADVL